MKQKKKKKDNNNDALSPLLFVIAILPHNHILRMNTNFLNCKKKIDYLMYMDDIKLFVKNEKEIEILIQDVRTYSEDIGMEFGIKNVMLIIKSVKRQMTEVIELPNKKIRMLGEKETYKYWNIESRQHQTCGEERKKNTQGERENYTKPKYKADITSKGLINELSSS